MNEEIKVEWMKRKPQVKVCMETMCPHCRHKFDACDYSYFWNTNTVSTDRSMDVRLECPECGKEFNGRTYVEMQARFVIR